MDALKEARAGSQSGAKPGTARVSGGSRGGSRNPFIQLGTPDLLRSDPSSPEAQLLLNDAIDQRLKELSENSLIKWRRDASRTAIPRIEKELYERSMGRGAPHAARSKFLGTWKEFATVVGILIFLVMVISGTGDAARGLAAINVFGTLCGIYIFSFLWRRMH